MFNRILCEWNVDWLSIWKWMGIVQLTATLRIADSRRSPVWCTLSDSGTTTYTIERVKSFFKINKKKKRKKEMFQWRWNFIVWLTTDDRLCRKSIWNEWRTGSWERPVRWTFYCGLVESSSLPGFCAIQRKEREKLIIN